MTLFGLISYGTAALVLGAVAAVLFANNPGGRSAGWTTAAAAASLVWSAGIVALALQPPLPLAGVVALDALHALVWIGCVLSWLGPRTQADGVSARTILLVAAAALAVWAVAAALIGGPAAAIGFSVSGLQESAREPGAGGGQNIYLALLLLALVGLLAIEQVFRNAGETERKRLRLLCLAIGGIFVTNVFVYSQASLLNGLVPVYWEARGFVNALLAPLILVALKKQAEWENDLFVSRQVVFYTASLGAVGGYLLAMSAVGYAIRAVGGQWSFLIESAFLLAALLVLVVVLFSASIRARAKVFIVKHFYKNKYDYREEWLRLTAALSRGGDSRSLAERALEGIAAILGSKRAALWLARDEKHYEQAAALGDAMGGTSVHYAAAHPVVEFLAQRGWVIDSEEYARDSERYGHAFGASGGGVLPAGTIVVPLDCQGFLQGFVMLEKPRELDALNFEDHDLLKMAGRQVAVVLAQALSQEKLTATRQFEAVNKLATFLMHDLKNVVAQQELVVANAEKFKHRPDFIEDAIKTIRSGAERMRKVLDQLHSSGQAAAKPSRVEIGRVIAEVQASCADRRPVPAWRKPAEAIWVEMDRHQLVSVLTHVIRNAQEATPADGTIEIGLERAGGAGIVITIADTGCGMDETFVRERLFKPFDSTKGVKGMGIGAYQARETLRAAGGDVDVESSPGAGTKFMLRLPAISMRVADQPAA